MTTSAGSARTETLEITEGEQRVFELEVLPGSQALLVQLGHQSDAGADLDISVFNCTDEEEGCRAAKVDGDPVGDERVLVTDPAAGTWKVVVDAFHVPSGTTSVGYMDAVFNPAYGAVNTTDGPQERKGGDRWLARVGTWLGHGAYEAGRRPFPALLIEGEASGERFPVALVGLGHGG